MEPRPEPSLKPTPPMRERWYLRVQGRTLGPLETEEVKRGLETGEFLSSDKITNSRVPSWILVSDHPLFAQTLLKQTTLGSKLLVPPPPPQLLRVKQTAAPLAPLPIHIPPLPPLPVKQSAAKIAPPSVAAESSAPSKKKKPTKPKKFTEPTPELIPSTPPLLLRDLPEASPPPLESEELEDPETNRSLDLATKELERFLMTLKKPEPSKEAIAPPAGKIEVSKKEIPAPIPFRPSYEPIFIGTPEPRAEKKKNLGRVIQIEVKLPEKPWRWLLVISALALATLLFMRNGKKEESLAFVENKTRDLKDSRLSDPSSPTNTPLEAGDPVPPLKAPTRPQRE